jgi:hypothetical protein
MGLEASAGLSLHGMVLVVHLSSHFWDWLVFVGYVLRLTWFYLTFFFFFIEVSLRPCLHVVGFIPFWFLCGFERDLFEEMGRDGMVWDTGILEKFLLYYSYY